MFTQEAFDKLLAWLDPERERAAEKYETIRARLLKLLAWRGAAFPEALADETIDRVACRIADGVEVTMSDPARYFAGVAWKVCSEVQRRERRAAEQRLPSPVSSDGHVDRDRRDTCMTRCLSRLPAAERNLMMEYHTGNGRTRIENRERLVKDLGLSANALRLRCRRIRSKLDHCLEDCLKA